MSKQEFLITWAKNGLQLAVFLAEQLGVCKAQIDLWKQVHYGKGA